MGLTNPAVEFILVVHQWGTGTMNRFRSASLGLIATIAVASSTTGGAQSYDIPLAEAGLRTKLAGTGMRDWIKVRESVFMGDGRCQTGERWRFAASGVLTVRRCIDGQWRISTHSWTLAKDGGVAFKLVANPLVESGRRVLFRDGASTLILRRMPDQKRRAVEDSELRAATGATPAF